MNNCFSNVYLTSIQKFLQESVPLLLIHKIQVEDRTAALKNKETPNFWVISYFAPECSNEETQEDVVFRGRFLTILSV